jgi:hypothetical protein
MRLAQLLHQLGSAVRRIIFQEQDCVGCKVAASVMQQLVQCI